jgi:hypothetical protein
MKLDGTNMEIVKLEHESCQAVLAAPSPAEYSCIKHEDEPLPFMQYAAVKTEVEVSCN